MQQALEAYITHKAGPFSGAPTTTGFASLAKIEPDFPNAESHIQSLLEDFRSKHPDADPAGRDTLYGRQLLDPKEAVCQIVMLPTGAQMQNPESASGLFPSVEDGMWCTIGACSTRSLSRGSVHINSSPLENIVPWYVASACGNASEYLGGRGYVGDERELVA